MVILRGTWEQLLENMFWLLRIWYSQFKSLEIAGVLLMANSGLVPCFCIQNSQPHFLKISPANPVLLDQARRVKSYMQHWTTSIAKISNDISLGTLIICSEVRAGARRNLWAAKKIYFSKDKYPYIFLKPKWILKIEDISIGTLLVPRSE